MNPLHNKRKGAIAECQVVVELMLREFIVSIPQGDYSSYDIIADNQKGRLSRIQVKSTNREQLDTTGYRMNVGKGNSSKKRYTLADCDFIICVACGFFYVIPIEVADKPTITVYPNGPSDCKLPANYTGQWEQYKDRWDLLD